jgi:hypothetical protein
MMTNIDTTFITKTLIFKKLNPPQSRFLSRFKYEILIYLLPPGRIDRLQENTRYDNNGNIIFHKWFCFKKQNIKK